MKLDDIYKQEIAELKNEIIEIHKEIDNHIDDIRRIKGENKIIDLYGSLWDKVFKKDKTYIYILSNSKEYYKKELREKLELLGQLEKRVK